MEDFEKITVQGSQIRQRTNIPGDGAAIGSTRVRVSEMGTVVSVVLAATMILGLHITTLAITDLNVFMLCLRGSQGENSNTQTGSIEMNEFLPVLLKA
ncbi:hypothetical protein GOBAR_AA13018 [Gossypium barbadense]|uniref:Uncharacterized protein n=1 Tax=Gossypium barbadense TaxID=3634 RepID=A0A2P5XWB3_GOSBA|nr:hypothetical protein GOBAR_AA13018 [Gossypium barbadense]